VISHVSSMCNGIGRGKAKERNRSTCFMRDG
jgi:hypothetical protein